MKIKLSRSQWETIGKTAGWGNVQNPFSIGDKVKLKEDVLLQHSKSVPAHAGFTTEQFSWRDTLRELNGKVGEISRLFPNSKHVNVNFEGKLIGIDFDQLEKV